ncbi:DUF3299 domain-containing protein [Haloferula helveola]
MMTRLLVAVPLLLTAFSALLPAAAEEAREVTWKDLLPSEAVEFDDPFAELSKEQLQNLGMIARVRNLLARDAIDPDGESARNEKKLVAELEAQGIDVDWILSQRDRVIEQRKKQAEQVDASMAGKTIRIPGYVLPLREDQSRITEFLLVPWVGACIHTPPPPPNQMIHVSAPDGVENRGRFTPVWIEGTLHLEPAEYQLFLVDGSGTVKVAYNMTAPIISSYSASDSDTLAEVEVPEEALKGHGLWQAWQTRVSLLFTKTMTDISERRSSGPLLWGLVVAFLYGVVHTLGPGHGKAVVVSYFIGHGGSLGRGIRMGTQIAVFHVLSAILVVWLTDFAVRQTTGQAPSDYRMVRLASYATIAGIGAFMLWKAVRSSGRREHHHDHGHHHDHSDGCCSCASLHEKKGPSGWLALAVGSVPCTGALLVLLFGMANDLLIPAILLVCAISLGMAVAMSGIGLLAIVGRNSVERRLGEERRGRFASRARIAAAALVLAIGCGLFLVTWSLPTASPKPLSQAMNP